MFVSALTALGTGNWSSDAGLLLLVLPLLLVLLYTAGFCLILCRRREGWGGGAASFSELEPKPSAELGGTMSVVELDIVVVVIALIKEDRIE